MTDWVILLFSALVATAVPELAIGASAGSLYYLLSARTETNMRKIAFMSIGWVIGYSLGSPFIEGGWAMLISVMGSAFAVALMLQISASLDSTEGGIPPFLNWVADFYHKIRKH